MQFFDEDDDDFDCGCSGFSGCGTPCSPCNQPITFIKGDSFSLFATFSLNGVPVDISSATAITMTVKTTAYVPDSAAIFTVGLGTGITITNGPLGQFTVLIPSSATLNQPTQLFPAVYDIVVEIGALRYTVFRGPLSLLTNVSDS